MHSTIVLGWRIKGGDGMEIAAGIGITQACEEPVDDSGFKI
jgi:hypothetical protein